MSQANYFSLDFLGRPPLAGFSIALTTEVSYIALYVRGFIPALAILLCAVATEILRILAISFMVNPFIVYYVGNY